MRPAIDDPATATGSGFGSEDTGVGVAVGDLVADAVGNGVRVTVGFGAGVAVGDLVADAVGNGVRVTVGFGAGVAVAMGRATTLASSFPLGLIGLESLTLGGGCQRASFSPSEAEITIPTTSTISAPDPTTHGAKILASEVHQTRRAPVGACADVVGGDWLRGSLGGRGVLELLGFCFVWLDESLWPFRERSLGGDWLRGSLGGRGVLELLGFCFVWLDESLWPFRERSY